MPENLGARPVVGNLNGTKKKNKKVQFKKKTKEKGNSTSMIEATKLFF